ncbi:MAG: Fe-S cluster assembly protein SufD [Bacteroidetes bacterium]|nr:Fe-S cluster assembly protein SufD [Bacteroidota bacterium]
MNTTIKTNIPTALLSYLESTAATHANQSFRTQALDSLLNQGLPNKKSEEYKYSPVEKFFKELNFSSKGNSPNADIFKTLNYPKLRGVEVFAINGIIVASSHTEPVEVSGSTIKIQSLKQAMLENNKIADTYLGQLSSKNQDPFIALNNAAFEDGIFIHLEKNAIVEEPIHIINYVTSQENCLIQPHHLFVFEENSQTTIIETTIIKGSSVGFVYNSLVEMQAAENSKINYYRLQLGSKSDDTKKAAVFNTQINQEKNSTVDTNTITINTSWLRNNHNIVLNGTNCEAHLNGLFLINNHQHVDNHTLVDHQQPHCQSNQLYKGILSDKSTGIFNGKIFVRKDAQKTNAYQSSKNILLSDDATINAKPQLEIYADDVKCSHGSSTGKIDTDALFYLRARGVGEESARRLLLHAFANDVIETIKNEELQMTIKEIIEKQLYV